MPKEIMGIENEPAPVCIIEKVIITRLSDYSTAFFAAFLAAESDG